MVLELAPAAGNLIRDMLEAADTVITSDEQGVICQRDGTSGILQGWFHFPENIVCVVENDVRSETFAMRQVDAMTSLTICRVLDGVWLRLEMVCVIHCSYV